MSLNRYRERFSGEFVLAAQVDVRTLAPYPLLADSLYLHDVCVCGQHAIVRAGDWLVTPESSSHRLFTSYFLADGDFTHHYEDADAETDQPRADLRSPTGPEERNDD